MREMEVFGTDKTVKVSDEDYDKVKDYKLCFAASSLIQCSNTRKDCGVLHHKILGKPEPGFVVVHLNRDPFDCTRENIKIVSQALANQRNPKKPGSTSEYRGVTFNPLNKNWRIGVFIEGRKISTTFKTEHDAAKAYDKIVLGYYGEYAATSGLFSKEEHDEAIKQKFVMPEKKKYTFSEENLEKKEAIKSEIMNRPVEYNEDGIAVIKTKTGESALVDSDIWNQLMLYNWQLHKKYAETSKNGGKQTMHSMVMFIKTGKTSDNKNPIDHINGNRLDNRYSNLRFTTASSNNQNKPKRANCSTGYIGVYKKKDKFYSQVTKDGKTHHLGTFDTALQAAGAYIEKAFELFGDEASLNEI